jgi:Dimethlysulfonioproprionate lyase
LLPVVQALRGLSDYAAPRTRALVETIAALAGELDWRQTYTEADFGARFLDNYGYRGRLAGNPRLPLHFCCISGVG